MMDRNKTDIYMETIDKECIRGEGEENRPYAYWLCTLPGIGIHTIERLLTLCGRPREIYNASEEALKQALIPAQLKGFLEARAECDECRLREEYDKMERLGIRFLLREDTEYPERLKVIPDAPYGIFYRGKLPREQGISVAVIGARECSEYGRYVARELGKALGEHRIQVISGMARGIDGISQEAALLAGGTSFGVLGCGVDICYPSQNRELYHLLLERGGILSAYPPGTLPKPQNFPPRNRIVSGLADAVIVIEARQRSGTLITVDMALDQGKDVYVVPGRVTDRLSDGCNKLLKQGAGIFLSPEDFLEDIMGSYENCRKEKEEMRNRQNCCSSQNMILRMKPQVELPPDMLQVYTVLDFYPQSIEQICAKLPDTFNDLLVSTLLMRLCLENAAIQVSPGYFCVKAT